MIRASTTRSSDSRTRRAWLVSLGVCVACIGVVWLWWKDAVVEILSYGVNGKVVRAYSVKRFGSYLGDLHGLEVYYWESGEVEAQVRHWNGVRDGTARFFDEQGRLLLSEVWVAGELVSCRWEQQGARNRRTTVVEHDDGTVAEKEILRWGRHGREPFGAYAEKDADGRPIASGFFCKGKRVGIWTHFATNGQVRHQHSYGADSGELETKLVAPWWTSIEIQQAVSSYDLDSDI